MKVKICGITNVTDAQVAAEAGADYLGFIFYPPSPRAITPETAQTIITHLRQAMTAPPVMVGVFVNETAEQIANLMVSVGLDLAQLSGDETPFMVADPGSPLYGRAYKAIRPATAAEAEAEAQWYVVKDEGGRMKDESSQFTIHNSQFKIHPPSLLVDTYHPTLRGGTGLPIEWGIIVNLFHTTPGVMLAGGLTPDNVAAAVRQVRPFAVDVASGVEASPGIKDHVKVRAFITNAKKLTIDN